MKTAKVDNAKHGVKAKVEIRRRVLEALTPEKTRVFDAFAGTGVMWAQVWRQAAEYVGCDERWHDDARCCFVADNRRVLRCLDLSAFTCFDLDAYGSPWEQALIVAARRPVATGERIGLVVTEGTSLNTRLSGWPYALCQAAGIVRMPQMGQTGNHDELVSRALHGVARRMRCRILREWRAIGVTGAKMRYMGAVLEGAR